MTALLSDWEPIPGPPCVCGCSDLEHRPRQANGNPKGPDRQDCLYGGRHPDRVCSRYEAQEQLEVW